MSRRARLLLLAAIVTFMVAWLALFPARVVAPALRAAGLRVGSVTGTVWQGEARPVAAAGLHLASARWTLQPLPLLLGRARADVDAALPEGFARGDVSVSITGALTIAGLEMAGPIAAVLPDVAGLAGGAQLAVQMDRLRLDDGWVEAAVGTVQLGQVPLGVPGGTGSVATGAYQVTFDSPALDPGAPLEGAIRDTAGPLAVAGVLRLTPPREYAVTGEVSARADAPPDLARAVTVMGPRQPSGAHEFGFSGSF